MRPRARWTTVITFALTGLLSGFGTSWLVVTSLQVSDQTLGYCTLAVCLLLWGVYIVQQCDVRHLDFLAPEIAFAGLYLLSSFGQVVLAAMGETSRLPLAYLPALRTYLAEVLLAFIGLLVGMAVASSGKRSIGCPPGLHGRTAKRAIMPSSDPQDVQQRSIDASAKGRQTPGWHVAMKRLHTVSHIVLMLASLVYVASFGLQPSLWSMPYGASQFSFGITYYLKLGAELLMWPSLALAAYCSAKLRRFGLWMIVIAPCCIVMIGGAARSRLLYLLLVLLVARNYSRPRIKTPELLSWGLIALAVIMVLSMGRAIGSLGPLNIIANAVSSWRGPDWGILLGDVGVPMTVTTNVIRWFPSQVNWLYGWSFVSALLNLVPGFFFGGSMQRPFLSMAFLYKGLIEGAQFNTNIGYGFAILAEAYANLGIAGGFIVMLLVGYALKRTHIRVELGSGARQAAEVASYGVMLAAAAFCLRGESLEFIKTSFYGTVVSWLLWWVSWRPRHVAHEGCLLDAQPASLLRGDVGARGQAQHAGHER